MRSILRIIALAGVLLVPRALSAADAYVLRSFHSLHEDSRSCDGVLWTGDTLFYNTRTEPVTISLLGASNGGIPDLLENYTFSVPPGTLASLNDKTNDRWTAKGGTMAVLHLDVPAGVIVESRNEVHYEYFGCVSPQYYFHSLIGKVSLPVYRGLTAPGARQVIVGTDLGKRDVRRNVAIYNDADVEATATIEFRSLCPLEIVETATVKVPAKTIAQYGPFTKRERCPDDGQYVLIVVDQPSLSFVSVLGRSPEYIGIPIPLIELMVPANTTF